MAEVIGLISGVLQLVDSIAKGAIHFHDFHHASKERRMLLDEVKALQPLLGELQRRINSSATAEGIQPFKGPLVEFEKSMNAVQKKLDPGHRAWLGSFSQRVIWMLWEKTAVRYDLAAIERFKSSVSNWLSMDIWDVLQGQRDDGMSKKDEVIRQWLAPHNPVPRQHAILSTRQEGTGEWLVHSEEFRDWISSPGNTLCLIGIPGAGKTVLTSIVVDHLQKRFQGENVGIAYMYCNHKETEVQTPVNLVAGLWRQLSLNQGRISDDVRHFYELHQKETTTPTIDDVFGFLQSAILTYSRVLIFVDAIDECPEDRNTRNIFLAKLRALSPTVNLLLTARPHVVVESGFPNPQCLEVRATEHDVRRYIDAQIGSSHRLMKHVTKHPDLKKEIENTIIKQAEGMFLLVKLHIESLTTKITPRAVRDALKNLHQDVNRMYDETMHRINNQNHDDRTVALQALTWISKAVRPLSINELQEALAIQPGNRVLDRDSLPDIDIVISVCAGLVVVDETKIVRLIHHTAQSYFDDNPQHPFPRAHIDLATVCLSYLSLDVFVQPQQEGTQYHLLGYAARYWAEHAHGEPESELQDTILEFLSCQRRRRFCRTVLCTRSLFAGDMVPPSVSSLWIAACLNLGNIAWHFLEAGASPDGLEAHDGNPLYVAAYRGHIEIVRLLLDQGADINGKGYYGTALQAAAGEGHEAVAKLLTQRGAEITPDAETASTSCPSPLQAASNGGYVRIVQMLLDAGADVNARGGDYGNALQVASFEGNVPLVDMLIKQGADMNASGGDYHSALKAASYSGNVNVVRLLIEKGADVNMEGGRYFTALHAATDGNHIDVLRLLIEHGARLNTKGVDKSAQTALHLASERGRVEVAHLLLDKGAVVDVEGKELNRMALHDAAKNGHVQILRLLLGAGVDANVEGGYYGNALQAAAATDAAIEMIRLLLDHGAHLNTACGHYGSPLQAAAYKANVDVVRLLVEAGASVNAKGGQYGYALQAASLSAEERIEAAEKTVRILLAHGADYNARGGKYGTVLHAAAAGKNLAVFQLLIGSGVLMDCTELRAVFETACCWGSLQAVQALIDKGADINMTDSAMNTPLQRASETGKLEVVNLLLENGANINTRGGKFGSALQAAAQEGHLEVVRLLISKNATLNSTNVSDGDALQRASRRGHTEVVQFLIEAGANVNARCGYYGSALQAASKMGKIEVVQLLIKHGAEINAQGGHYGTALQATASGGAVTTMECRMITETRASAKVQRLKMSERMVVDSNAAVAQFLIDKGADVNIQGGYYGTALQAAAKAGDVLTVQLLLKAGADFKAEGGKYGSAVQAAEERGHTEIVQLLVEAGADRIKVTGDTPTHRSRRHRGRQDSYEPNDYHHPVKQFVMRFVDD
ncbi:ankyrin repeat-containing domain protein [Mycena crocata]|nr:ankyrin repeat-containing domain protein [Mycena crocata]